MRSCRHANEPGLVLPPTFEGDINDPLDDEVEEEEEEFDHLMWETEDDPFKDGDEEEGGEKEGEGGEDEGAGEEEEEEEEG